MIIKPTSPVGGVGHVMMYSVGGKWSLTLYPSVSPMPSMTMVRLIIPQPGIKFNTLPYEHMLFYSRVESVIQVYSPCFGVPYTVRPSMPWWDI